ncbi:glycosyltransferase [Candidatus Protochlamydia sp. W-9]|uniref:glycosyltransferase n=1 Tax=Candidatus Protochlamydia sp. W-9 TaxID=1785087 RepID=UPI00096ABF90|nr:glycosyltransferase [Candidatus Protochlamydia sp. W-9]
MKIFHHSKRIFILLKDCIYPLFNYLRQGYRSNLLKVHWVSFARHSFRHLQSLGAALNKECRDLGDLQGPRIKKLRQLTIGLHTLMSSSEPSFSYSILIPVSDSLRRNCFCKALFSALQQTAPNFEILVGYNKEQQTKEIETLIKEYQNEYPQLIKTFSFSDHSLTQILNSLAQFAEGDFLFILDPEDWIRPDFFFRCEQFLRLIKEKENGCIYTDEYEITENDDPIPGGLFSKPNELVFPYLFHQALGRSVLIPRQLWNRAGGMEEINKEELYWDLALRLDLAGAKFYHLPFYLYAKRCINPHFQQKEASLLFVKQLEKYSLAKKLTWSWGKGLISQTYRAIPALNAVPKVQVIIPFKNQKILTLKTIHSILKQKNVQVFVTAIDNDSQDETIASEIRKLGSEVIIVKEPFNYSRLNNIAVERTIYAKNCDYLLFLNNDVELEEDALEEMCRWIVQPMIGMVGCQLHYPNGLLQHGGIDIKRDAPANQLMWISLEKLAPKTNQKMTKIIRLVDAVTAACSLMKKTLFVEVGGFDEIWYPIAYSDTNLATKVKSKGFYCLYTPYAKGIHHESASRKFENIEDVEMSSWLDKQFFENYSLQKQSKI